MGPEIPYPLPPAPDRRLWKNMAFYLMLFLQMVVLMDPTEDPDDILRANRSREKQYVFDYAFDGPATQVSHQPHIY